jgi:hypothetical protein
MASLPDDYWHKHVYVHFGWLSCSNCGMEPDLRSAWEGIDAEGEEGVALFTARAVERLKRDGWTMRDDGLYCSTCSANVGLPPSTST